MCRGRFKVVKNCVTKQSARCTGAALAEPLGRWNRRLASRPLYSALNPVKQLRPASASNVSSSWPSTTTTKHRYCRSLGTITSRALSVVLSACLGHSTSFSSVTLRPPPQAERCRICGTGERSSYPFSITIYSEVRYTVGDGQHASQMGNQIKDLDGVGLSSQHVVLTRIGLVFSRQR